MAFKFHKRTRNYWSLSKLAIKLREAVGITNPKALTMEGWAEYKRASKAKAPFTYWLTKRFFNKAQNFILCPSDLIYSIRIHFKNSKGNTHVLDGGLDKGQWYDITYRIPYCLFSELEKFIEKEKGLETHEWEKTLVFNEDWGVKPDDEKYGKLTPQALAAIEQDAIYSWWKENKGKKDVDFENEEDYLKQEEEMLIRLVKVRNSLWS